MKRAWLAALVAALALGSAAGLRAQKEAGSGEEAHHQLNWDKLKDKLGLTDDQVNKLKESHKQAEESMKPLQDKLKGDIAKLKQQVDSKASDNDIQSTLDSIKSDRKDLREQMDKNVDNMGANLTPTQKAKIVLAMSERREKRMGKAAKSKGKAGKAAKGGETGTPSPTGGQ